MPSTDVCALADKASFNRFHGGVLMWCALIIVFDGYDLAVAGIALPSIMKEYGVDATQAGFMVSSALFGMMFGNVVFGTLADRMGRKPVIAACIAIFSLFTAAAGFATDPLTFSFLRFLAGVGIGGVMPTVIAHMTEYAPQRMRSTLVTLMFSGYSLGGVLAAFLGKHLIESYGWQSVFIAAGLPVLLIPFMWFQLPESMLFLIRRRRFDELRGILARLSPGYRPQEGEQFVVPSKERAAGTPVGALFADGRGLSTLAFWLSCFLCLFMVYALSSWLTKLMSSAGYSLGSALTFVLVLNLGAMAGAIGGGWLADRFHIKHVLTAMYLMAAVSITLLGVELPKPAVFALVALAGASTIGTQIVLAAYAGQFYPASIRTTGVGMMLGVGRAGAIAAPILIGALVGMSLPLAQNFLAIGIPGAIAALSILFVNHARASTA
ncbi:MFS transporter [Aquincola sp. MAHUQ-54]|uniref:MFS transporter n=1 Tax=Aquincola agrisoli TaxID=3119538 RepID=A0AAW9Q4Z1_9BURK